MNKKILILIIIGVLIVVGGIYWWQKSLTKQSAPTPAPPTTTTPTSDQTANWKTYQNNKYGFEVKYPGNMKIRYSYNEGVDIRSSDEHNIINAMATINDTSQLTIMKDFPRTEQPYNFFGIEAKKFTGNNPATGDPQIWLVVKHGNYFYTVMTPPDLFDSVISTFKFIGSDQTANWKTYINDKFGFELKYDPSWKVQYFTNHYLEIPPGSGTDSSNPQTANNITFLGKGCNCFIDVQEATSTSLESPKSWLARNISEKKIMIAGTEGVDRIDNIEDLIRRTISFVRTVSGNKYYKYSISLDIDSSDWNKGVTTTPQFEAILSSFVFKPIFY
jgi:hypothetical protein